MFPNTSVTDQTNVNVFIIRHVDTTLPSGHIESMSLRRLAILSGG